MAVIYRLISPLLLPLLWWADGDLKTGLPACKAGALPLSYSPKKKMVTPRGFEPLLPA